MAVKKSQLFVTALVIALVTAACSGSDSPAAAGPEASPDEEPAVLVEQHPVSPITIDDLGEPDFFDQVDWELTWDDDVVTIRHSDACGDECLTRKTLTVLHRNDGLPEFTSFVVEELRFEGNETSEINAGRLEIEQWSSDGPLAGRFFDQSDRRLMVFHFGSLTTKSKTGQLSNDDLRSALMSNEPLQRIEALRTIIEHPADRSELRDEMINLLDDTNVVPTLFEQQTYGTLRGPWQVVGEHAAIALHRALNWPNPPSFATAGPSQLWIAINRSPITGEPCRPQTHRRLIHPRHSQACIATSSSRATTILIPPTPRSEGAWPWPTSCVMAQRYGMRASPWSRARGP